MPRRTFLISVKVLVDTGGFVIRFAGVGKLGVTVGPSTMAARRMPARLKRFRPFLPRNQNSETIEPVRAPPR